MPSRKKTLRTSATSAPPVLPDNYRVLRSAKFLPQNKTVLLIGNSDADPNKIVLFKSKLRINTDGSPNSYHPFDLPGHVKAINSICNAISVRSVATGKKQPCATVIKVFEQFRDNNWTVPSGYKITWNKVIAARNEGGRKVPCVFQTGEHKGYFGSLTSLKNDLPEGEQGECQANNQLDQRFIPALVLAGGANPVREFGARVGDLLVAFNPRTNVASTAIIGDTGPEDNLGEGSVALNMALLGVSRQPTNYTEAKRLDTGRQEILVAIIPRSRLYQPKKPYTKDNIHERMISWQRRAGFDTTEKFIELMKRFQSELRART
jgi:hypothetical protein